MLAFVAPFLYCLLLGSAWSVFFGKKFADSLAPALMLHMIVVMLCGMALHSMSVGIYGGMAIFVAALVWGLKKTPDRKELLRALWDGGLFVFFVLYLFCFFSNSGKRFGNWDEFGHWGMFLKESLRLDMLYAESPLPLFHKDYVPATTLFEFIWCRLSGRFVEADAYRAIQMVMFAMMLPMFERFAPVLQEDAAGGMRQTVKSAFSGRGRQLAAVFFVLLLPLLFSAYDTKFYHSIYIDYFLGVVFFYCIMRAWQDEKSKTYQALVLALGFATLLLTKQSGIALLPLAFALHLVKQKQFEACSAGARNDVKLFVLACAAAAAAALLWYSFTAFVDWHVTAQCDSVQSLNISAMDLCSATGSGNIQSYSGFRANRIMEALKSPERSSIEGLREYQEAFVNAILFERNVLLPGAFVPTIIFISILVFALAQTQENEVQRRKMRLAGYFIVLSALAYIELMYFIYIVAFPVERYVILSSYERYMSTFILAIMLFAVYLYYDSCAWKKHITGSYTALLLLFGYLLFFQATVFSQVLPGSITRDGWKVAGWEYAANRMASATPEYAKIYVIKREEHLGRLYLFMVASNFYAGVRTIHIGNIGPSAASYQGTSRNLSQEQLYEMLKGYDYLYLDALDEAFVDKYSEIFERPDLLKNDAIYRIVGVENGVISLEEGNVR